MAKYQTKTVIVEAVPYKKVANLNTVGYTYSMAISGGFEQLFLSHHPRKKVMERLDDRGASKPIPFLKRANGQRQLIHANDMILTFEDGSQSAMSKEEFKKQYEKCPSQEK